MRLLSVPIITLTSIVLINVTHAQINCNEVLRNAPRNYVETSDRSRQLLKYGRSICSAEWRSFSDARQSKQDISLSLLDELGLTSNDSTARQTFEEWKRTNCDNTRLKQSIYNDLVSKQSLVSDLVYRAYEACIAHLASQNAMSCSFLPANSDGDGFLVVLFRPNGNETETTLAESITLQNGVWTGQGLGTSTLPAGTKVSLRENYFPLKRNDLTKGDFLRVSLRSYPGQCAVDIPPWPTFSATLVLRVYYVQQVTARTRDFPVEWTGNTGKGPKWICVSDSQARQALSWNDDRPIDYRISDYVFNLTSSGFPPGPAGIELDSVDKVCGMFAATRLASGTYSFRVTGNRRVLLTESTKVITSRGEPIFFKIEDWRLPQDVSPGSKLSYEYSIQISERRGNIATPVITVSHETPTNQHYKSSIDSQGVVTLAYE